MRDTFTKIFPGYNHGAPTCYISSNTHIKHVYPEIDNDTGRATHDINRNFTHKKDAMKDYHESILKIKGMMR